MKDTYVVGAIVAAAVKVTGAGCKLLCEFRMF
jgi:hypothetical protein